MLNCPEKREHKLFPRSGWINQVEINIIDFQMGCIINFG